MTYDIITIGDCIVDIFIKPHELETYKAKFGAVNICFEYGEKIGVDEAHEDIGGSACNVAVSLSRLDFKSAVIGSIGGDSGGEKIKEKLQQENVDTSYLKTFAKNKTNFSMIIVYKGERTIFVYRGLKDYSLIKIPKTLRTKWFYLGPVANSFEKNYKNIISLVSEKNVKLAVNPGHRQIVEGREALKKILYVASILILNKQEAIDLCKISRFSSIKELLKRIKSLGPEIVIITDGQEGSYAYNGEKFFGLKAYNRERVDATGAGDSFSSGFLASYIKNNDICIALKWGTMNSSEVVMAYGAQTNLPTLTKLEKMIDKSPDIYNL